jgi:hypothetical protein
VATVVCSRRFLDDLARAFAQVRERHPAAAPVMSGATTTTLRALELNPLLGRRIEGDLRELVISSGATGLIALYRFIASRNEVRVLALRGHRELGYQP